MPGPQEDRLRDQVVALLKVLSGPQIRAALFKAIQQCIEAAPQTRELQLNSALGIALVKSLAAEAGKASPDQMCKEVFLFAQHDEQLGPFREALWELIRGGILVPGRSADGCKVVYFRLTATGEKIVQNLQDHPLAPQFVRRLQERCAGLDDEIVTHLEDAHACRAHGLLRPSAILLGLAYEVAVERISETFLAAGLVKEVSRKAHKRITDLKSLLPQLGLDDRGVREAVAALDYADHLRERRNDGSHTAPRFPFDDAEEIDELLLSAGRHLPPLWGLRQAKKPTPTPAKSQAVVHSATASTGDE